MCSSLVSFPAAGLSQNVGMPSGTGQADYKAVAVREAHYLTHPDRGKGPQVEAERRLDVARLQAQVI